MKRLTRILLVAIMLIVLGCGTALQMPKRNLGDKGYSVPTVQQMPKLTWYEDEGYSVPSQAVQQMLDVTVLIKIQLGLTDMGGGSGLIIDANEGVILTNNHIAKICDGERFYIMANDGEVYICDQDNVMLFPKYDLAFITIGKSLNLPTAVLTEVLPGVGETIMVVGSPLGEVNFNSISTGVLSGVNRVLPETENLYFVQTDAAVNPGSSGGPWFDKHGKVFAISARMYMYSQNLGYGIPMKYLRKVVKDNGK